MSNLEKKFYKYLDRQCAADDFKQKELRKDIAHELAEIAADWLIEYTEKGHKQYKQLIEENITLKKQLEGIRYFNRNKVWDCFEYELQPITPDTKITLDNINNIVTAICNLAIPEQKYLDKINIAVAFSNYLTGRKHAKNNDDIERNENRFINELLSLAIKPITREKIIDEEPIDYSSDKPVKLIKGYEKLNKDDILNDKPIDCYSKDGEIIKGGEDE